jgi:hypothetical protein
VSNALLIKNYKAAAAVTKFRIVKMGGNDYEVQHAAAATDTSVGITTELDAALGERVDVIRAGLADVEYGGTITRGDQLTADANGKAVVATQHDHTENTAGAYAQSATTAAAAAQRIIGIAEVSGVAGDIGSVLIAPGFA